MGFDFSDRRVGVAVGQSLTGTAEPLVVIPSLNRGPDWDRIGKLIAEWRPQILVVGLPLNMDGTEQEQTRRARRFGRQLGGRFGLPVHWSDERLSTREARDRMERGPRGTRVHRQDDDHIAAQVILEGWFMKSGPG